jgi:hypothetical protein
MIRLAPLNLAAYCLQHRPLRVELRREQPMQRVCVRL